ncbi:MAG: hypothetical protein A2Z18_11480 [Armatimonadetes bacterium RBG_16_58_9]|nr:MAG: hypothetical protein A2Z18_11480 [Armatimonadetes bacterium RBG_16_58_9]
MTGTLEELIKMESPPTKIAVFVIVVLAIGMCLGVSFLKFHRAAQPTEPPDAMRPAEKLRVIEKHTTGADTTRNFIAREKSRTEETKRAEEAAFE